MSTLPFHKYQGTGNDFIMVDNRNLHFDARSEALIQRLCHRRFGIGADGLILLENADGYDFRMVYFNADGREGSMCGNGGRCTVKFAQSLGLFDTHTHFLAVDGPHEARVEGNWVYLKMMDVSEAEQNPEFYFLDTGSPHYVQWINDLENFDVFQAGRTVRYNDRFREPGTNVNFVEKIGDNQIFVRTYERGVEDETYSCGTGVTACALVSYLHGMPSPVRIKTLGGELEVSFESNGSGHFRNIYLAGPAEKVFEGSYAGTL
ncbi:MAG: diaminopimelate epimerase [Bacteroidia bacterium]|nr:diaminopimelate epimerase [Bacteroidia bacterium]